MIYQGEPPDTGAGKRFHAVGTNTAQTRDKYMFAGKLLQTFVAEQDVGTFELRKECAHGVKSGCEFHLL